jgi:dCMP deaminase
MKPKFQQLYRNIAQEVANMSHARRRKVGAIIVKDDRIISMGYNGMPAGWDNDCEDREYSWQNKVPGLSLDELMALYPYKDEDHPAGRNGTFKLVTKPEVLHAESNAIAKLAKSSDSGSGADLFVTTAPCIECAKLIYQSGISRVFYGENYRNDAGIKFLKQSGVEVIKHDE